MIHPFRAASLGVAALLGGLGATSALACPNYQLTGQQLTYSAQDLGASVSHAVVAGGNVNLATCGIGGNGYVITNPDFELVLTDNTQASEIEFRVEGTCDTVLLINDAYANWQFNDDDAGLNPRIRLADAPAATYDIWVGTYGPQNCQANLIIQSYPTSAPMAPSDHGGGDHEYLPDPGNLTAFRGQHGTMVGFTVTGSDRGSIWGTDVYTDDSMLAVAAVHAGVLQVGETGNVLVTILPGQQSYGGTSANGVTSSNYGSWGGSYAFAISPDVAANPDPGNMSSYRGQVGSIYVFDVVGSTRGSVWGSGIYTDDSMLAAAAVHAGVLAEGERGLVTVEVIPSQPAYYGSEANGVQSSDYGAWGGSFWFLDETGHPISQEPAPAAPQGGASK